MDEYFFKDRHFSINTKGIDLRRNGFKYDSIDFKDISHFEIAHGNPYKNRVLLLIIGISASAFALFYAYRVFMFFSSGAGGPVYIEEFLIPLFPLLIGIYCIYASMRRILILYINSKKTHKLALDTFLKEGGSIEMLGKFINSHR